MTNLLKIEYLSDDHPFLEAAKDLATNPESIFAGFRCLKQPVVGVLVKGNQILNVGFNDRGAFWVTECPRIKEGCATGEGYNLCKEVCQQVNHAETNAIKGQLQADTVGSELYLWGHYYVCRDCTEALRAAGVKAVYLPESARQEATE